MEFDQEDAVNWVWSTTDGLTQFIIKVEGDRLFFKLFNNLGGGVWRAWASAERLSRIMADYVQVKCLVELCGPSQNPIIVKIKLMETRHKKYLERKHGMV